MRPSKSVYSEFFTLAVMYSDTVTTFSKNAHEVERLIDFDRDVIDIMISSFQSLKKDVPPQFHSLKDRIDRATQVVINIRDNESLKPKFGTVCNQAVVLLVSHFSSALGELFKRAISETLEREDNKALLDEEIKLTFREIKERNWDIKGSAGDLVIAKKDLTFQDMQSTVKAFDVYVGVQLDRDQRMNNIILGQAARHVIVHAGAQVTGRMLKQLARVEPRSLKPSLKVSDAVVFSKQEVLELKAEMLAFIEDLVVKLEAAM